MTPESKQLQGLQQKCFQIISQNIVRKDGTGL